MKNRKALFDQVCEYVAITHLWNSLERSHPHEQLNELMIKMVDHEESILKSFGLPHTFTFSEYFQFLAVKADFKLSDVDHLLNLLETEAVEYLQTTPLTDFQFLQKAQEQKLDIENVLPALSLKLQIEPYYDYIYHQILLKNICTPEEFLTELNLVISTNCSGRLHQLALKKEWLLDNEFEELKQFGFKFMMQFLKDFLQIKEVKTI